MKNNVEINPVANCVIEINLLNHSAYSLAIKDIAMNEKLAWDYEYIDDCNVSNDDYDVHGFPK